MAFTTMALAEQENILKPSYRKLYSSTNLNRYILAREVKDILRTSEGRALGEEGRESNHRAVLRPGTVMSVHLTLSSSPSVTVTSVTRGSKNT